MKKLLSFSIVGTVVVWQAAAQTVDTHGEGVQYEEAIAYLAPILQADSGNSGLLGYAGNAYYVNDDYRSAEACYQQLLAIDSNNIPALHYFLQIDANDHPADAMIYAGRLARIQKDHAHWSRMMAELFARMNHRDSALVY